MKYILPVRMAVMLWCYCAAAVSGLEIQDMLLKDGGMFRNGDADVFLAANSPYVRYFNWVSDRRREARYPGWGNSPRDLTFAGRPVPEAIFRFRRDRSLKNIYVSLYNRGDSGPMEYDDFQKMLDHLEDRFQSMTGERAHRRKTTIESGMKAERWIWIHRGLAYVFQFSVTAGRTRKQSVPEYLQLEIEEFDPDRDPRQESLKRVDRRKIRRRINLRQNVRSQRNGTVFIEGIPMVDQGDKGYCVVATVERILRYFGIDNVTQHGLAQIAGSSPESGTSIDEMLDAVRRAGGKLGVTLTEKFNLIGDLRDAEKILKDYNRLASRKKRGEKIRLSRIGRIIDLGSTFRQMDPEIYMDCRNQKSWRRSFEKIVRDHIDDGLPVLWSVFTGLAEGDHGARPFGAHLRLIIGYNSRTDRIIYSDSWGAGHEKKEMPLDDACAITLRMLVLKPRN